MFCFIAGSRTLDNAQRKFQRNPVARCLNCLRIAGINSGKYQAMLPDSQRLSPCSCKTHPYCRGHPPARTSIPNCVPIWKAAASAMDLLISAHRRREVYAGQCRPRLYEVPGLRVFDWSENNVSGVAPDPAQYVRDKSDRTGLTRGNVEKAIAHARTFLRRTNRKQNLRKHPR